MLRLSANLGFLWTELPLADAIRRAKAAGFDAVECHWPYESDPLAVRAALEETGLPMLGINTRRGRTGIDNGLAAVPGREAEARAAIDEAFAYGARIGAGRVHVMAGNAFGIDGARETFEANLAYACDIAALNAMGVLIEPLNHRDAPGYFLVDLALAADIAGRLARPELSLMFDCYHLQITGGDLLERFRAHRRIVGHVQIAAVPSRAEPDGGEVAYERLLPMLEAAGYEGYVGAEYRPATTTEAGLGWMARFGR
ncbi:TIM barrel protein [Aurantimonas sp. 22II-16-19i]|uniref:hydroxypyruvate isomerase family protein n=1 Tax=Aurantimonas sp. 22II-16-19i TaxID=1317114 RepID=UPI0009F7EE02|nr:TIM barrel protein [Aurantimonas sp. 22II-16-19i]ORE95164.1 hydroxypyruvate isomerase [Aurantimonas sp. 22II-16-19i]